MKKSWLFINKGHSFKWDHSRSCRPWKNKHKTLEFVHKRCTSWQGYKMTTNTVGEISLSVNHCAVLHVENVLSHIGLLDTVQVRMFICHLERAPVTPQSVAVVSITPWIEQNLNMAIEKNGNGNNKNLSFFYFRICDIEEKWQKNTSLDVNNRHTSLTGHESLSPNKQDGAVCVVLWGDRCSILSQKSIVRGRCHTYRLWCW